MVASIKPHRDELGLGDGLMLIDGQWTGAASQATWHHVHPATGNDATRSPVAGWRWLQLSSAAAATQRPSMSMRPSPRPSSSRCGAMDATMACSPR